MAKANKRGSLSDKIAGILTTAPGTLDPEDDIYEETKARVTSNDFEDDNGDDEGLSKFRKQNVNLLEDVDTRYTGKKGSRKYLKDSDEDWETEDEGLSTDEGEALDGIPGTQTADSDYYEEGGDEENADDDKESDEDVDYEQGKGKFKHMSETNISIQVKKGKSVRNQLNIWESLLEIRIQLQKCLLTSNKLPQYDIFPELKLETEFKSAVTATKKNVSNILDKFLLLQSLLLKQYGETKTLFKAKKAESKKESDEEILSDTENEEKSDDESEEDVPKKRRKLSEFENEISTRQEKYKNYRNSAIQKWNNKTRLAVGKHTGSNTVLQQIDYILGDKLKLLKRTQLKRSEYVVLGKGKSEKPTNIEDCSKGADEYDTEIFDDNDFYHQLLRELIEFKSGDITDPVQMSRQWIALQNLRSKMKRKIDTRATKGRKIRYVVHSKLVNFMAPIPDNMLTEDAKNELYSSLFGNNQVNSSFVS